MKASDLRELKDTEVALVRDHKKGLVLLANHNSEFGMCDCCKDWSLEDAEVLQIIEIGIAESGHCSAVAKLLKSYGGSDESIT